MDDFDSPVVEAEVPVAPAPDEHAKLRKLVGALRVNAVSSEQLAELQEAVAAL